MSLLRTKTGFSYLYVLSIMSTTWKQQLFVVLITFTFFSISRKHFLLIVILFSRDILSSRHSYLKKKRAEAYFLFYNQPVHSPNVFLTIYHSILAGECCANYSIITPVKQMDKELFFPLEEKSRCFQ